MNGPTRAGTPKLAATVPVAFTRLGPRIPPTAVAMCGEICSRVTGLQIRGGASALNQQRCEEQHKVADAGRDHDSYAADCACQVARATRRPKRWLTRPRTIAAAAEPIVKKTVGSPDKLLEPNICSASSAPTVMPAASPAPLRICANSRTARVRRCSGASSVRLACVEPAAALVMTHQHPSRSASSVSQPAKPCGPSTTTSDNSVRASSSSELKHTRSPATLVFPGPGQHERPLDHQDHPQRRSPDGRRSPPLWLATPGPCPPLALGSPTRSCLFHHQSVTSRQLVQRCGQCGECSPRVRQLAGVDCECPSLVLDPDLSKIK